MGKEKPPSLTNSEAEGILFLISLPFVLLTGPFCGLCYLFCGFPALGAMLGYEGSGGARMEKGQCRYCRKDSKWCVCQVSDDA